MRERLLFVGFDSATPSLLTQWARQGRLPALGAMLERGQVVDVMSPVGAGHVEIWASLLSGVNLGRHGVYEEWQMRRGTYDYFRPSIDRDYRTRPLWSAVSDAGLDVAVFDAVRAPLTAGVRGVQIADWLSHLPFDPPRSSPPQLISELRRQHGDDPVGGDVDAFVAAATDGEAALLAALRQRANTKTAVAADLLRRRDWNLGIVCFGESHCVGHYAWHPATRDALLEVYRDLDNALAALVSAAGDGVTVIVAAGPGFAPLHSANQVLDRVLMRLQQPRLRYLWSVLRQPPPLRLRRYFAMPHNAHAGAVRINLVGREPHGRVAREDYERQVDELCGALGELRSIDTGRSVIDEVVPVHARYSGDCLDDLPDVLVVWKREADVDAGVTSRRTGPVRPTYALPRSGDHTTELQLFIAAAANSSRSWPPSVRLVDVAPSICAHVDVAMPEADGCSVIT